jgi:hypothetical protein
VTSLKAAALVLVSVLMAGCGSAATSTPKPVPSPPPSLPTVHACTTHAAKGGCGPYNSYAQITGITSSTYVGNNVWNPIPGWKQTLHAIDPGNWQVTANMPAGNTAVVSYPSIGANYGQVTDVPTPLTSYSSIRSSFSENMHATAKTSAWAAYDVWLGQDKCAPANATCPSDEVMIQHDFANNGACTTLATASFGGFDDVPVQTWHLCKYGTEIIWKLGVDDRHKVNEQSGRVDILAMLIWLVNHGYLPHGTGLWSVGYGWEICSTGGVNENFQVSRYSITPTLSRHAGPSPAQS